MSKPSRKIFNLTLANITEDEYRRARDLKLPCFIDFKHKDNISAEWHNDEAAKVAKLAALKEELLRNHTIAEFKNTDELAAKVTPDLHRWLLINMCNPSSGEGNVINAAAPLFNSLHQLPSPLRRTSKLYQSFDRLKIILAL